MSEKRDGKLFLEELPKRIAAVEEFRDPESKVEDGEQVVGVASDYVKAIYTILSEEIDKVKKVKRIIMIDMATDIVKKASEHERVAEFAELDGKIDAVKELMWCAVKDEMGIWGAPGVGIRSGFQIVLMPRDEEESCLEEMLARLGSRGGHIFGL